MKKALTLYLKLESFICVCAFVVMIAMCVFQVLNRNVLKLSIGWTEEAARYAMIWMAMLGSAIGLRDGKQMSVEFFYNKMPHVAKRWILVFSDLVCIVFAAIAGVYSVVQMQMYMSGNQVSAGLKLPMSGVFVIIPICLFIMAISQTWQMIKHIRFGPQEEEAKEETDNG
ncbi:MAG: TRAP transporter small permease [Eubacteriales bacterium]|jgi:TRAP-type C4-dicarboxylate transport system permease small subunit